MSSLQPFIVGVSVLLAALWVLWSLAGLRARLLLLRLLRRLLPVLHTPLGRLQQRLQAPTGCTACRTRSR